jgi:hypothetical protein
MGIDLVSTYGLRTFLNKFKRKGIGSESIADVAHTYPQETIVDCEVESSSRELIFLLASMIRSTGFEYGVEQKSHQ